MLRVLAAKGRTTFILSVHQYLLGARDGPGSVNVQKQLHSLFSWVFYSGVSFFYDPSSGLVWLSSSMT